MEPERIENLKGFLCTSFDGKYFFRTYNEDGTYSDYQLCHADLKIQILDTDAYVYNRNGELCIDYSPKTLGIETEFE